MAGIDIRKFHPDNEPEIENITYRTGFKGEGLQGRDYSIILKIIYNDWTSSRNTKALPFYKKHGYQIIQEIPADNHSVFKEILFLTFVKDLTQTNN
jgi:hypothetical protein